MKVYLVRHGESEANTKGLFSGVTDTPLTDFGRKQAREISDFLSKTIFEEIYSSPLSRAYETASLINEKHHNNIIIIDGLIEMNFGIFEGLSYKEIKSRYPDLTKAWQLKSSEFVFPEGESLIKFYKRIVLSYEEIIKNSKSDSILIVAHSGVIRSILANEISESFSHYWKYRVDNCRVSIIEYSDGYKILNGHNIGKTI